MDERLRNFYLESRVKNASPGELLLMLWEALVENAEQAEAQIAAPAGSPERTTAARSVMRCIDIITELSSTLRPEVDPTLCATLSNLYLFFTHEFSEALSAYDAGKVGAMLPLLRELKAAWAKAQNLSSQAQFASGVNLVAA
jgi:flagellar biosynthetic protein FliS